MSLFQRDFAARVHATHTFAELGLAKGIIHLRQMLKISQDKMAFFKGHGVHSLLEFGRCHAGKMAQKGWQINFN